MTKYIDKFGDIWVWDGYQLKRQRDGNIGGWWDGEGLEPYG